MREKKTPEELIELNRLAVEETAREFLVRTEALLAAREKAVREALAD